MRPGFDFRMRARLPVLKRHPIITGGALVLAVLGFTCAWISLPTADPPAGLRETDTLRIATANVYLSNPRPSDLVQRLIGIDPDILLILEFTPDNLPLKRFSGSDLRPVLVDPHPGTGGICVLAGPRVETSAMVIPSPFPSPCAMPMATLRVKVNGFRLSILGIHAPPPVAVCQKTNGPTLAAIGSWIQNGRLRTSVGVTRTHDPVLVAGDFNALPTFRQFRRFSSVGLIPSQDRSRLRRVGTWSPAWWFPSGARIDYILTPEELPVLDTWVIGLPGSDHRAVVADIRIPATPQKEQDDRFPTPTDNARFSERVPEAPPLVRAGS